MKTIRRLGAGVVLVLSVSWTALAAPAGASEPGGRLRAVPFTEVRIEDGFWAPRRATNRWTSLRVNFDNLEKSGNLENLRRAARGSTEGYEGPVFMDSDVYKALEAASYSLATDPDPDLEKRVDEVVSILVAAQRPDGYLNSYYTVKEPGRRWTNLRDNHELYCAGHLIEAAVAHHQATGKATLLGVATRFADHIDSVFGPPPKRLGYPGHPEIELALVKLWRDTGNRRYFELARFFVENRGRKYFAEEHKTPVAEYDGAYWQDDVPIVEHRNIKGHAVRAAYLMSGVTDVATELAAGESPAGAAALQRMLRRVWRNTVERNQYITGGIGPSAHNEGFTEDYDLPNASAYQETCATIALAQWAHRLGMAYADAAYLDVVERALYNGTLAGVSDDGGKFFYVNPLESRGGHHRSGWFSCACCPPNVARTLASLGGYAYATGGAGEVYVNLYIQGSVRVPVAGGRRATLHVTTDYPWDGRVRLRWEIPEAGGSWALKLRVPEWCEAPVLEVGGRPVEIAKGRPEDGYLTVNRAWATGDEVVLDLPMPVRRWRAHPNVKANRHLAALQRGPLVYCVEQADHAVPLDDLYLPEEAPIALQRMRVGNADLVALKATARAGQTGTWERGLYRPAPAAREVSMTAIPYYAWDNRTPGAMRVWLPSTAPLPPAGGPELSAKVTGSFPCEYGRLQAVQDGKEPEGSRKHPGQLCHTWPRKGGEEWIQYTWERPWRMASAQVYWFDDTGRGECRPPASWQLEYRDGAEWKPVASHGTYGLRLDAWNTVDFDPVTTTALRLKWRQQDGWSVGVHEWKVQESDE